ncbi:acyltransferase family protein [Streptomyces cavernicola]|uniref:Acyltransferase n=1 Tax=Streptomyces cavernicola TaxID=3043613 RepID=A0ABT6SLB6_9ACTN|nr:acyltransferase [Streptomyces sp. B-S-A6]MDI3408869.1 acyltransferase [Streptomyces sp. B-S-A6]
MSATAAVLPAAPKSQPVRDRYLDLLRALALVRVVAYHLFGWAWLTVLFPSMGVMFVLAGSLMARSLKRTAWSVIRGRIRRLLPPVWLFAAVVLPLMLYAGWQPARTGTWAVEFLNYLLPLGAPPFPERLGGGAGFADPTWAEQAVGPLWYVRAYLWFVVASPLLLWAFRRAPWATLLAPLALTAVVGTGLVRIPGETGEAVADFATYGSCWVLGFAHHDGLLRRMPRRLAVGCAALAMAFGLWWASGHLGPEGWDLNDIPLAQAAWSLGFVIVLLRYAPEWRQLPGGLRHLDRIVTLANNRAVTIYLWHNLLILATVPVLDLLWDVPYVDAHLSGFLESTYTVWMFLLVWPLLALAVLGAGWAEDLAAKRRPRLWPDGAQRRRDGSHRG